MTNRFLSSALAAALVLCAPAIHAAPGDLDPTFGTDGLVQTDLNGNVHDEIVRIAIRPDGKIVAVGATDLFPTPDSAIARYNADGSLDTGFNGDGKAFFNFSSDSDAIVDLAFLPDGGMLLLGALDADPDPMISDLDVFLAKVNANGDLVTDFGASGLVTEALSGNLGFPTSLLLQEDGKIVAIGVAIDSMTQTGQLILLRYDVNGDPDPSFGNNGKVEEQFSGIFFPPGRALLRSDGKILVAGALFNIMSLTGQAVLVQFNGDGSLDDAFGNNGVSVLDAGAGILTTFTDVGLQSDGKSVAAGDYNDGVQGDFLIARFEADGALDTTFGPNQQGYEHTDVLSSGSDDSGNALLVQANDKIVVVGSANDGVEKATVVRYQADGSLDNEATFSDDGVLIIEFPDTTSSRGLDVAVQADGKLVIAATPNSTVSGSDFGLARLTADEADLAISITADDEEIGFEGEVTFTILVANNGPIAAANVTVDSNTPEELALVSAAPSQGTCNGALPLNCGLGTLEAGSEATIAVAASAVDVSNAVDFTVSVSGAVDDTAAANNEATAVVKVGAGGGCSLIRP